MSTAEQRTVELRAAWWQREWLVYLWSFLASIVAAVVGLRLWHADLRVPFEYQGDAIATAGHISTVLSQGWFEVEPRLGAPAGEFYYDFPQADNFTLIMAKAVGLFSHEWPVVLNVVFLLGFPLAAITATWFLRKIGVGRALTVALAVAYAIAPYHFQRGESHLYLGEYWSIPLAMVVLVWVLRGERLFTRRPGVHPVLGLLTGRGAAVVLIGALLGTASQYYSVFFLVLLVFAGVASLVVHRSWVRFLEAAASGVVVLLTLLVNLAPNLLFQHTHGAAIQALDRTRADTEIYAFKLAQLLLPWPGHQIGFLRHLRAIYDQSYPLVSEYPALGALAAAGLVAAFLVVAYLVVSRLRSDRTDRAGGVVEQRWFRDVVGLSFLVWVAFLFGTIGGLSTFVSFLTTMMRGWNRIAIMMAILCLGIIGLLIDRGIAWLVQRARTGSTATGPAAPPRRAAAVGVPLVAALVIGCIAIVDQTPYNAAATLQQYKAAFLADQSYFASVQKAFSSDATILQLPYIRFPEDSAPDGALASGELVPFLQTTGIRWTAGGIKGRPGADWSGEIGKRTPEQIAALAAAAGMDGILIDKAAFDDGGNAIVTGLRAVPGARFVGAASGRWVTFDLSEEKSRLTAAVSASALRVVRTAVTRPVTPYPVPDFRFAATAQPNPVEQWQSGKPSAAFTLENPGTTAASGTLGLDVSTTPARSGAVEITLPDGTTAQVELKDGTGRLSVHTTVAAGISHVTVALVGAQPAQSVQLGLENILFTEDAVQQFLDSAVPAAAQ